jgi:hypothetical protein
MEKLGIGLFLVGGTLFIMGVFLVVTILLEKHFKKR